MKRNTAKIAISGVIGFCGKREVFFGFAPASLLHKISFADILNDDTGLGYQRPYSKKHSVDFQRYISLPGSSTIPLTFNLRKELQVFWAIKKGPGNQATLALEDSSKCLAQVDCQHRIGELAHSDIPLAFMTFIGLDLKSEMSMFVVINSKAKGLSTSLTDYHESNLLNNLAEDAPHLYISRKLNEDVYSPWFRLIRYGGETTSGLKRKTSFRMMQKSILFLLKEIKECWNGNLEQQYELIRSYWDAVKVSFPKEWKDHRCHLITKGVGLYSMNMLLAELIKRNSTSYFDEQFFVKKLLVLKKNIDWHSRGTFATAGGQKGAKDVFEQLKKAMKL